MHCINAYVRLYVKMLDFILLFYITAMLCCFYKINYWDFLSFLIVSETIIK